MDPNVPYMPSVSNLHKILDAMQRAGVPDTFGLDFLKDLGFTSSNDRPIIRVLKYLGMLDAAGRPQGPYREFVDHTRSRAVLANRLRGAYDDLFLADRDAYSKSSNALKGWFKTKTGAADKVAEKMATTFRSLAQYADFNAAPGSVGPSDLVAPTPAAAEVANPTPPPPAVSVLPTPHAASAGLGLVYRLEIHLPDTQNVDTFRAIFRALREELMP